MTREWLYRRCGRVHGPLSLDDLRAAAFLGFLQPGDLVRDISTTNWVEARAIESLAPTWKGSTTREPDQQQSLGNDNPSA